MVGVKEQQRLALGDKLYEQYARPLEAEHRGKFIGRGWADTSWLFTMGCD
jgi:hypothetical protein